MHHSYFRKRNHERDGWQILEVDDKGDTRLLSSVYSFDMLEDILRQTKPGDLALLYYDEGKYALYLTLKDGNLQLLSNEVPLTKL